MATEVAHSVDAERGIRRRVLVLGIWEVICQQRHEEFDRETELLEIWDLIEFSPF